MKKGISLVSLTIVIVVMVILAGIVVITGLDSTEATTINTFAMEILNIQNAVDEYKYRYEQYPVGIEKQFDLSQVETLYTAQFDEENIQDNKIAFKVIDLSLIGIKDTEFGKGKTLNDIYVLSETTGKVYYIQGVEYKENKYYTLTEELYTIINATPNVQLTSMDVKVYDVIFTPSQLETTNKPVTVLVKIPKSATINSIVTTEGKSVGQETINGMYKQVEINTTSEDKTGNYNIIVNYTHNNITKTAEYAVENYDATLPTITYTEEIEGNLKKVNFTINNNGSTIKVIKYEQEIISNILYFKHYGRVVTNNQFVIGKDDYFTIYIETISGTIVTANNMPEGWEDSVTTIVDGVPIPRGFTASPYDDENKKKNGLVIYELAENETRIPSAETQFTSWTTRNQYVWVPVDDFAKFVRKDYINTTSLISNTYGSNYWEVLLDATTNLPHISVEQHNSSYITQDTVEEVQTMYASVKKYGGFFIARYEAGIDREMTSEEDKIITGKNVHSKMKKIPYNYLKWSKSGEVNVDTRGAIAAARSIYPIDDDTNTWGVVSTLPYGVQWDRILNWWLDSGTVASVTNSTQYGNYADHVINSADELNEEAWVWDYTTNSNATPVDKTSDALDYPKSSDEKWMLSTGALKAAKIHNIYDMAGNLLEWTMEGYSNLAKVYRGGAYATKGVPEGYPLAFRSNKYPVTLQCFGFRVALYIK